jgi:dihydrolipoamide dehydrogenase
MKHQLIVLGGGPAGVVAALRASELGAEVALVERRRMGGTCTNDGCVPTRVLARTARLARDAQQFEQYGLVGQPPVVDFAAVLSRTQHTVYKLHEKKQLISHLENAGVTVYGNVGDAKFVDEHTLELPDGSQLQADKFIICAGGRARRLNFPGSEYALTHSDVWSLNRLPASIAIVGGAATGCQLASIFSAFGSKVNLLEVAPRILAIEDPLVSEALADAFCERGVEIITGISGVQEIEKRAGGFALHYTMADEPRQVEAQAVIMAVGWPGNADRLNLEAAGVKHQRGYIQVDDYLQTTVPHIFAAGDITGRMMLVQSGSYEARIAAENAVLGVGLPYKHQIVPHGGFTDPEYGSVGLTEDKAKELELDCVIAAVPYANLDRAVIDGHPEGFCKLIASQETHRILGAHVVGEQALEVIQLVAASMASGTWVEQLAELEIAYPTYTAIIGLAARQLMTKLGVMPLSPQWRTLGRSYASEWERSEP